MIIITIIKIIIIIKDKYSKGFHWNRNSNTRYPMLYDISTRVDVRSVHGSFHFQRHIPRATDSRNVSANYPIHDSRFHQYGRRSGRQVDITSAGGNNATRRQGGSGETWRRRRGEGEKGLFPREGTICRENFKNATPWSGRNEISQRILIRLRPAGRRGRSIQIIWPSRPPREMRGRRVSCECRCQGKRTSYVSHGRRYPLDEISRTVRMPRVIGFDGFTW